MERPPANPHVAVLRELFPGILEQIINNVITLVEEGNPNDTYEGKLENMINLISADGAWGGPIPNVVTPNQTQPGPMDVNDTLNMHYENLLKIFPDASPGYILQFCRDKQNMFDFDDAIDELSANGYEKVEVDPLMIWEQLRAALPDADPIYLKDQAKSLAVQPPQQLDDFLQNAIEKNDYPTMKDYVKNKKTQNELALYQNDFSVDEFLEVVPNPVEFFSNPERKPALDENADEEDVKYAITFLYNHYNFIRKKFIDRVFGWKKRHLVETCDRLDRLGKCMRRSREFQEEPESKNIALLQEIAYLRNRKLIKRTLKARDEQYRFAKEEARKYNLLEECQCCFDNELIPEECYFCMKGCVFCKECMVTGVENVVGKAEFSFPCFANCDSEFSVHTLQMVLPKKTFELIVLKIASEEIKKANVDGLETCPFCDFAMILPPEEKILKCGNPDCLVESCRECRHKSHVPLRCNEIEYDEDVRRRTFIENKMTEALTRTCHSCKKKFIKSNGCNKMVCTCGAKMCYLCGAAIKDYNHFRAANGCALFTNDLEVDLRRVVEGAMKAKQELGDVQIKFDPAVNIENFYRA